jgi:hypothetical protein
LIKSSFCVITNFILTNNHHCPDSGFYNPTTEMTFNHKTKAVLYGGSAINQFNLRLTPSPIFGLFVMKIHNTWPKQNILSPQIGIL